MDNEFESKAGQIRQLAALPPDQFVNELTNLHPNISEAAPNIAPHVFSAATNAVQFLNQKLPYAGPELMQDKVVPPSRAQQSAWLDLHKVIDDPTSVFKKIENHTLNRHHVEALQSVYPDLHEEMKSKILEHLGDAKLKGTKMPYGKKLALSKFLGMPLDGTMTPQSMQAIIQSASVNTGPEAQAIAQKNAGGKPSGPQLTQINKVNSIYQTPAEARQVGKRA